MTDSPYKIDMLKMYFGEPCIITDKIIINQPTIGDILDYGYDYDEDWGESQFFTMLNAFIGNPTMYRLPLWDMGIDWNKISDFELFSTLVVKQPLNKTHILFGDVDFTKFSLYQVNKPDVEESDVEKEKPKEVVMYNKDQDIEISEDIYKKIALYLRTMFNIFPKVEKAKGKSTKDAIIWEDRENLKNHKDDNSSSILLPLVSGCLNHPGFKYRKDELRDVGIVEFMDSVKRLQVYESANALLHGIYSGMIDTKGIKSEEFDFMRDIYDKK